MKTDMTSELRVPTWRFAKPLECVTPDCHAEVQTRGDFCALCRQIQNRERERMRAKKAGAA